MKIKGFTIIDLMIVVAIIGIILVIALPIVSPTIKKEEAARKERYEKEIRMERYCKETYGPMWKYEASWCYNEKSGEQHKVEL